MVSKERSEKQANEVFAIILLNPYFYLIGSVWGMFDVIPAFFTLATVYAIMDDPVDWESPLRPIIAGICLSIAVLAKLYPVILIPLCLIHLRRKFQWLWFSLSFGIAFALVCAPFFFQDPDAFLAIFEFHAARIGGGITYWNGLWLLISQGEISEETAIEWSGYYIFLFVGALLITYISYWRAQRHSLLTGACLVVWAFAFAFKLILEQYCVWILTFTILFLITRTNSRNLRILGSLGIILIPTVYLIISVPLPDLFYVDVIREQRDLILSYSFYERQQILFILGCLFAGIHFLLWLIGLKEIY
ncbi:MAG: hypothetical protein ACXACI_02810 [Candidatus Hodarchaeales archaeon]